MTPLIYITSTDKFTVTLGLTLFSTQYGVELQYLMPMSILAMIPTLIIFFAAQK